MNDPTFSDDEATEPQNPIITFGSEDVDDHDQAVGSTIIEQLGGRMFCMMVGVKSGEAIDFVRRGVRISFGPGANGEDMLEVRLNLDDTYDVRFCHVLDDGISAEVIKECSLEQGGYGLYAEDLVRVFEEQTGLATRLHGRRI